MFDLKIQIYDFLSYCKDRKVISDKTIKSKSLLFFIIPLWDMVL